MGPRVNGKKPCLTKKGRRKETVITFLPFDPKPGELPMDRHILENVTASAGSSRISSRLIRVTLENLGPNS